MMIHHVMMDAKFTLFAILLAIAIASPSQMGTNNDVPDFAILYAECPLTQSVPNGTGWINFPEQHILDKDRTRVTVFAPVEDSFHNKRVAIATIWPAPKGHWNVMILANMNVSLHTRDKLYSWGAVSANQRKRFETK